jgi:hypothetical protein
MRVEKEVTLGWSNWEVGEEAGLEGTRVQSQCAAVSGAACRSDARKQGI